jgi:plasmid stabilization system protein ParE
VKASLLLSDHPYAEQARGGGLRDLGIGRYPYILRYRVTADAVEIASVWHDRQKRPR